jgi:hypothetical protein
VDTETPFENLIPDFGNAQGRRDNYFFLVSPVFHQQGTLQHIVTYDTLIHTELL